MNGLRCGWGIFWDENHPPSKICGNSQIRPADKLTEKSSRDQRKVDKSDVQISVQCYKHRYCTAIYSVNIRE